MAKLGFVTYKINIGTKKIDGLALAIYKIVIISFSIYDQLEKIWFFKKTSLLVDISIKVTLEMFFLIFLDLDL